MSRAPLKRPLAIAGPEGDLEALLELPGASPPTAIALVLHPHPLHGGTMENKVVHSLARSFVTLGAAALRFNFRGVGRSAGEYDDGAGEIDDASAAAGWLRSRYPAVPLFLGGFSFGAAVAARAAGRVAPSGLVTVALPFERLDGQAPLPRIPWLLLHGARDELIDLDALIAWLDEQADGGELGVIAGADHFFHGKLPELRAAVERFFGPLAGPAGART